MTICGQQTESCEEGSVAYVRMELVGGTCLPLFTFCPFGVPGDWLIHTTTTEREELTVNNYYYSYYYYNNVLPVLWRQISF